MAINKRFEQFDADVEAVVELYFQEDFAGMEAKLLELEELEPEKAKRARRKVEDLIEEQYYLSEGEEIGLW